MKWSHYIKLGVVAPFRGLVNLFQIKNPLPIQALKQFHFAPTIGVTKPYSWVDQLPMAMV